MSEQAKDPYDGQRIHLTISRCTVTLLPSLGGKIASIQLDGQELLQAPLAPYATRTQTMGFDESDASGWDECLPSVAACTVETPTGNAMIPDHGDLWRVPWYEIAGTGPSAQSKQTIQSKQATQPEQVTTLQANCFSLPLTIERTIALSERNGSVTLRLNYKLTNTGRSTVPWAWAAHPLFVTDPGDRVLLPASIHSLRLEGSGGERLGQAETKISWPVAKLATGAPVDLSLALAAEAGVGDKLFAGPLVPGEGWCVLERPTAGVRITVRFDPVVLPYLGLWLCAGGWPEGTARKQVCAALEPTTAPVDSLATPGPWQRQLAPGEQACWQVEVQLERLDIATQRLYEEKINL